MRLSVRSAITCSAGGVVSFLLVAGLLLSRARASAGAQWVRAVADCDGGLRAMGERLRAVNERGALGADIQEMLIANGGGARRLNDGYRLPPRDSGSESLGWLYETREKEWPMPILSTNSRVPVIHPRLSRDFLGVSLSGVLRTNGASMEPAWVVLCEEIFVDMDVPFSTTP